MIDEKGPGIVLTDSAAMVKGELLEADANTILLLHFDEGAGNVVYDTGPHSFRGAVNHSDEGDWPAGISGTAIDLDGEFDYVDVPYNETFNPGNKVTVEAWIYQRSAMPYQGSTVVTKRGGYLLTTDGFLIDTVSGVKWANRMNYTVLDEWTYIVGTFDGKDLHYYVNGRLSGSGNSTDPMEQQINNIRVGAADLDLGDGGDPFYLFDGMIDEVRVSNVARTAEEINQTYLRYKNNETMDLVSSTYLISKPIALPMDGRWGSVNVTKECPANTFINVTILDGTTKEHIAGFAELNATNIDIAKIDPVRYPTVMLKATFNQTGNVSGRLDLWSVDWDVVPPKPPPKPGFLPPPGNVTAYAGYDFTALNWDYLKDGEDWPDEYRVYRDVGPGVIVSSKTLLVTLEFWRNTFIDKSVLANVTYYYIVTALNESREGEPSNVVSAMPRTAPWPMFRHDTMHTGRAPFDASGNEGLMSWRFKTDGAIISSPSIGPDGTIYVGSNDGYMYAVFPNGTLRWKYKTGGDVQSSPAIGVDGTIVFGSMDKNIYALYPNGTLKWKYTTGDAVLSSALVGPGDIFYIGSTDNYMYSFYSNGTMRLKNETFSKIESSPVLFWDGDVYFSSYDPSNYLDYVYWIPMFNTSEGGWGGYGKSRHIRGSSPSVGSAWGVYFGSDEVGDSWGGKLYAFSNDNHSSGQMWTYEVDSNVRSSAAHAGDDTILFVAEDGYLYNITPDAELKWKSRLSDSNTGFPIYSSPTIDAAGNIYVGGSSTSALFAMRPNGTEKWRFRTEGPVLSSPAIASDGTIYVGCNDTYLYAIGEKSVLNPTAPSAPNITSITNDTAGIHIGWAPPFDDGGRPVKGYEIYRSSPEKKDEKIAFVNEGASTYVDTNLTIGETYEYYIVAINDVGKSPGSNIASMSWRDWELPVLVITSPTDGAAFNKRTLDVKGTVSDNTGISRVEVRVNGGVWVAASGNTTWNASVDLESGENIIEARATDEWGNIVIEEKTVTMDDGIKRVELEETNILLLYSMVLMIILLAFAILMYITGRRK